MHFVKTEELKTGMRLARPIYNKKSILLFDRNSLFHQSLPRNSFLCGKFRVPLVFYSFLLTLR